MAEKRDRRQTVGVAGLHLLVEGRTEETFVNAVLKTHLAAHGVRVHHRIVETSRSGNRVFRGGVPNYAKVRRELQLWMRNERRHGAWFTTMFDFYGLPGDFPGYAAAMAQADASPYARAGIIEAAFAADIADAHFLPYVQLHEFETLIFADALKLAAYFPPRLDAAVRLAEAGRAFPNPEHIDMGETTAPSKRITQEIPAYARLKATAGPYVAALIGLPTLRAQCPHFGGWLTALERLGAG